MRRSHLVLIGLSLAVSAFALELKSSAFEDGGLIPKKYAADGADLSPPLRWTGVPAGTVELALVCDDPDAPGGDWVHWVAYGIPRAAGELAEGARPGPWEAGRNSWDTVGYRGPKPPAGTGTHRYVFTLYALDAKARLKPGAGRDDLDAAMKGHVLGQAKLVGKYASPKR